MLYEDLNLIAISKPSRVHSAPTQRSPSSAIDLIQDKNHNMPKEEAGLLHRLDYLTTGVLLFAKNEKTYHFLRSEWNTGKVKKVYRAIVISNDQTDNPHPFPKTPFEINTPLGRSKKSKKKMMVLTRFPSRKSQLKGKPLPALTFVKTAQDLQGKWDLTIEIQTGVMHQIRAHLNSIGFPVLGDPVYPRVLPDSSTNRLFLHAWKIEIPNPEKEGKIQITASLPEDWPTC